MFNLAEERLKQGYTQREFAKTVGLSYSGYCNIEKKRYVPSVPTAKKIAEKLNIDWRKLYE